MIVACVQSRFGRKNAGLSKSSEKRTETKAHVAIVSVFLKKPASKMIFAL